MASPPTHGGQDLQASGSLPQRFYERALMLRRGIPLKTPPYPRSSFTVGDLPPSAMGVDAWEMAFTRAPCRSHSWLDYNLPSRWESEPT